jgi:hypothetical protein
MNLFDEIFTEINKKADAISLLLGEGGASDYSHYCELVGERRGLLMGLGTIRDIKETKFDD